MGTSQSNQTEHKEEEVSAGNRREEFRDAPRTTSEQVSEQHIEPKESKVQEVSPEKKVQNERMTKLDQELQERNDRVKMMREKNSKKRGPCNSANVQAFRSELQELREIRDQTEKQMTVGSAQVLINHIVEVQEDAQELVEKLKALEDGQEESRRALRQLELDTSKDYDEDGHVLEDSEVGAAGSSVATVSVKPLYKDIAYQISMIPKNFQVIQAAVNLAVRTGRPSLAKNKEKDAQSAFARIDKNIEVIIQKGLLIVKTCGHDHVEMDLLTAFVKIRDESIRILDEILEVARHWGTKSEDESAWLKTLDGQMKSLDKHIGKVTETWKTVKIPDN